MNQHAKSATDASAASSPTSLSRQAALLYRGQPLVGRWIQILRPFICPFHVLVEHVPRGAHVLDVGCGSGLFLGLLAATRRLGAGTGFDISSSAIAMAKHMAAQTRCSDRLTFEHQNVGDEWPNGAFDVVSMLDVMHHVAMEHRRGLIARVAARVRPGGLLLYKDMANKPWWMAQANRLHDVVLARQWIRYTPVDQVVAWAEAEGLLLRHNARLSMLWYRHELAVFEQPA